MCNYATFLRVPNLIRFIEERLKSLCNANINIMASVALVRPPAQPRHEQHADRRYTLQWAFPPNHDRARFSFEYALYTLYQRPGGSRSLPEIKRILFRYLHIAGARFTTSDQLKSMLGRYPMIDFVVDVFRMRLSANADDTLRVPESVRFPFLAGPGVLRLVRASWTCSTPGCGRFLFADGAHTFTASLIDTNHGHAAWTGPGRYCGECLRTGRIPDWIGPGPVL